jgi:hypothetical protein
MLRGSEWVRLISMIGTLCILGLIIARSMNLGGVNPPAENRTSESNELSESKKTAEAESVTSGATDEDPEEMAAAEIEFQALTDNTVGIKPNDMFAYLRLFDWVEHQSFTQMKQRAARHVTFDDLMRTPDKFRGKLVEIDLNVRQAIPFDEPNVSDKKLYEIRGYNQSSGAWLYFVIAPDWPSGMKTGGDIHEQVRVEGYFLKIHGYEEAGAKPRAAPLKAPLLIGRVKRLTNAAAKPAPADYTWLYWTAGGFLIVSFCVTLAQFFLRQKAKERRSQLDGYKIEQGQAWLAQENPPEESSSSSGGPANDSDAADGFDFKK